MRLAFHFATLRWEKVSKHKNLNKQSILIPGVVDERHKLFMGTAAISSSDYIHACIDHADLILMVGHDVVEKPPFFMHFSDQRRVIHINYFGAQVDEVYFPEFEIVGDIGNTIWRLKEGLKVGTPLKRDLRYFEYVKQHFEKHMSFGVEEATCPVTPPYLLTILRQAVPDDGIVCLDNGLYKVQSINMPHCNASF